MDNARPNSYQCAYPSRAQPNSGSKKMKADIHPAYADVAVTCSCGNKFTTRSTLGKPTLHVEVCSECHPFYTGTQKIVDTAGRIEKFNNKYKTGAKAAA